MKHLLLFALVFGVLLPGAVAADILEVSPAEIIALPSDGSGISRVAMKFDLSGIREGRGRRIDNAILIWTLPATVSGIYELEGYVPDSQWTKTGITSGTDAPKTVDHLDAIILAPRNIKGGKMDVRLSIRDQVSGWLNETAPNYGIIITTKDVTKTALESHLDKPKLKIWYGFVE